MTDTMTKEGLVVLANDMLSKLHVNARVQHWSDINSDVFVTLLEGLLAEASPDIIRPAKSREDEVHNCQAVIDTLSMDILNTPLSHITGEAVVEGDTMAISNLLDIMSGLMDYLLDKIGSDISTDNDEPREDADTEDLDRVTPTVIDDILERELGQGYNSLENGTSWHQPERDPNSTSGRLSRSQQSRSNVDNTADLIALGQSNGSVSAYRGIGETTADLIALGDSVYKRSPAKRSVPGAPAGAQDRFQWAEDQTGAFSSGLQNSTAELVRESESLEQKLGLSAAMVATSSGAPVSAPAPESVPGTTGDRLRQAATRGLSPEPRPLSTDELVAGCAEPRQGDRGGRYQSSYSATVPATSTLLPGQRPDLRSTAPAGLGVSASLITDGVGFDSSLTSSVALPQQPVVARLGGSNQFASLGLGLPRPPKSSTTATTASASAGDARTSHKQGEAVTDPPSQSITCHMYHHFGNAKDSQVVRPPATLSSTVPASSTRTTAAAPPSGMSNTAPASMGISGTARDSKLQSYQNLQALMQDTMAMAQAAIRTSPFKDKEAPRAAASLSAPATSAAAAAAPQHSVNSNRTVDELSQHLSEWSLGRSQPSTLSASHSLSAASLGRSRDHLDTTATTSATGKQGILPPSGKSATDARRKVSFLTTRSSEDTSGTSYSHNNDDSMDIATSLPAGYSDAYIDELPIRSTLRKYFEQKAAGTAAQRTTKPSAPTKTAGSGRSRKKNDAASRSPKTREGNQRGRPAGARGKKQANVKADNFDDYLKKYYGHGSRLYSVSDGEVDYGSDREGNSADGDISDIDSDLLMERYRELPDRIRKSVRFEDLLDDSAPGRMGGIRRKLKREDQKARLKADFIGQQYQDDLMDIEDDVKETLQKDLKRSRETESNYKKKVLKTRKLKDRSSKKYSVPSSVLYSRPGPRSRSRSIPYRARKRSASASPGGYRTRERVAGQEILPMLLEEFPFLYLSTETLHSLWRQSSRQVEHLAKAELDVKRKKSSAQCEIEEADKRQKIIANIMRKELEHRQRVRDLKDRKKQQYSVNSQLREKRQQSARARRYYDEYQVRMRSKMLKKRTKEELVFKKLFREGIDIQKDRIRELRKYTREQREVRVKKQKDELESQENYYRDQFNLLAEMMAKERHDIEVREAAQAKVLQKMQTELRRKMEGEIHNLQEQIFRDEDDVYFRELDAERLRQQLHLARYQARV